MKPKYFWIKERHNPQLGTYYVPLGIITTKEAYAMGRSLYGNNIMHKLTSESAYKKRLDELRKNGENVQ